MKKPDLLKPDFRKSRKNASARGIPILLDTLSNGSESSIIFSLDRNYCYTSFNQRHFREMKKVCAVDIEPGMNILDCIADPLTRKSFQKSIDRVLAGESYTEIQQNPEFNIYYELSWEPLIKNSSVSGVAGFVRDVTGRIKAEEEKSISDEKYLKLFNDNTDSITVFRMSEDLVPSNYIAVNKAATELLGFTKEELLGMNFYSFATDMPAERVQKMMDQLQKNGELRFETIIRNRIGELIPVRVITTRINFEGSPALMNITRNIRLEKETQQLHSLSVSLLQVLLSPVSLQQMADSVVSLIRSEMQFSAVGIRFKKGEDYPYLSQSGFSESFLKKENSLVAKDKKGRPCMGQSGDLMLACNCGLVLSGKTELQNEFLTKSGSFATNGSEPLLQLAPKEYPGFRPRNTCIHQGYGSVAIIPIRSHQSIIGTLQLNAVRKHAFSAEMITFFEGICLNIGNVLMRKQAEEKISDQEHLLRLFIESTPAAIAMLDKDMKYIITSKRFLTDYNLPDDDIIGKSHYDVFPEIPQRWKEIHQRCLAGASERNPEDWFTRQDGSRDCISWEIHPWYHTSGSIGGILIFSEVITEQKNSANSIQKIDAQLRATLNAIPDLLFEVGESGHIYNFHSHRSDLLAAPPRVFIGNKIRNVMSAEVSGICMKALQEAALNNYSSGHQYCLQLPQGKLWFELSVSPMTKKDDEELHFIMLARDITIRKNAEIKLLQNQVSLEESQKMARLGSWSIRLPGFQTEWSTQNFHNFSYPADRPAPDFNDFIDQIHPEDKAFVLEWMRSCMAQQDPGVIEFRLNQRDGVIKVLELQGRLILDENNNALRIDGTTLDVSQRRKMTDELLKLNRLQLLNSQINNLILRTKDRKSLFDEICEIAVTNGNFPMSWICTLDEKRKSFTPVAWYGLDNGFIKKIKRNSGEKMNACWGEAVVDLLAGKSIIHTDIANDPEMKHFQKEVQKRNCLSSIAIPIREFEATTAVLHLYARESHFFSTEEVTILENIAKNISFSLESILTEEKRKKADEALLESEDRFLAYVDQTGDALFVNDISGRFIAVNKKACTSLGYREEELLAMTLSNVEIDLDIEKVRQSWKQMTKGQPLLLKGHQRRKDGYTFPVEISYGCFDFKGERNYLGLVTDITEREATESKLCQLTQAVEQSPVSTIITDTNGLIQYVNPKFVEQTGYEVEEIVGKNSRFLSSGEKSGKEYTKLWNTIQSGKVWTGEFHNRKKDGSLYWENATISPILNAQGVITSFLAVKEDITTRKLMEAALIESEETFRHLFEDSADPILLLNDTGFIDCNTAAVRALGHTTKADIIPLQPWEISPARQPDGRLSAEKAPEMIQLAAQNGFNRFEWTHLRADGSFIEVDVMLTSINLNGKKLYYTLWRDITARKLAEEKLEQALGKYELVNNATSDTIWELNVKADYIIRNKMFGHAYGYLAEEQHSTLIASLARIHPNDKKKVIPVIRNCIQNKLDHWKAEYRYLAKNGTYRLVYDRAYVIYDSEGNPATMYGAMTDLTEKQELKMKLADYQLQQQKLLLEVSIQAHEEEKSELGKELHDNISQMLASVKMYLGMAKSCQTAAREDLIDQCYGFIDDTIKEVRNLSHSLVPPSLGEIGLREALETMINKITFIKPLKIDLSIDHPVTRKPLDKKIELMFFRIIQEQLNNIIKYADAKKVKISMRQNKEQIHLCISDDGKGFDPEQKVRGIGLKNMLSRVEYYSGELNIISSPGNGCAIDVKIPIRK